MNKFWIIIIGIAIITVIVTVGYEIVVSINGGNVQFSKTVTPINPTFGEKILDSFTVIKDKVLVQDAELNEK